MYHPGVLSNPDFFPNEKRLNRKSAKPLIELAPRDRLELPT